MKTQIKMVNHTRLFSLAVILALIGLKWLSESCLWAGRHRFDIWPHFHGRYQQVVVDPREQYHIYLWGEWSLVSTPSRILGSDERKDVLGKEWEPLFIHPNIVRDTAGWSAPDTWRVARHDDRTIKKLTKEGKKGTVPFFQRRTDKGTVTFL